MKLPTEIFGNVVVVHTPEELGGDQAERLVDFLTTLERSNVIVDLDGTEAIDSEGLASLLHAQETLRGADGELRVAATNKVNRKILEITRLDQHLEVYGSVIDAVKSFV
jgi:anti-sigma B factor antagonist